MSLGWSVPATGWNLRVEKGGVEYLAIFDQSRGYCPLEFFTISFVVMFVPGMEDDSIYFCLSPCIWGGELVWGPHRDRGSNRGRGGRWGHLNHGDRWLGVVLIVLGRGDLLYSRCRCVVCCREGWRNSCGFWRGRGLVLGNVNCRWSTVNLEKKELL